MNVGTDLFQWLNEQMDLTSSQVDLVDGFVYMLRKIQQHGSIRTISEKQLHPRFWRSHDRTFGYHLMRGKGEKKRAHLYQFYTNIAFKESFIRETGSKVTITEEGTKYISKKRDEQLDLLFTYIW
ncbi:hypothetical protein GN156_09900 [bacterium LRH843]|nr:hypothetical protein [bacterium LRH843]